MNRYNRYHQDPHELKLAERLDGWTSDVLKAYVKFLDGPTAITRKVERIAFICGQLLNGKRLKTHWNQMDPVSQRAVSNAFHNDGIFNAFAFVAQYEELPERPDIGRPLYRWNMYLSPILFDLLVINGSISPDLMPLLRDLVLPEDRFQIEGSASDPVMLKDSEGDEHPITIVETEKSGRINLLTYLRMVEQGQLSFSASNRRLTAGSIKKVYNQLVDGDFVEEPENLSGKFVIRPFGLDVFVSDSGLMTNRGNLSKLGKSFLETQDFDLFEDAFERWIEKGRFDELSRIKGIKGLRSKKTKLTNPSSRRENIIEALSWCPAGEWISPSELFRAMVIWDFDFELEETPYQNLNVDDGYWELSMQEYNSFIKFPYIEIVLLEYLATLGLIDIGCTHYSPYEGEGIRFQEPADVYNNFFFFRINPLGAYILGQADEYAPNQKTDGGKFTVDSALNLTLLEGVLPGDKLLIESVGASKGENRYQLDAVKLLNSVEAGQPLSQYRSFLLNGVDGEPPAELLAWLDRLESNLKAVKAKQKATIYTVNQAVAELIKNDATLSGVGEMLTDKTVLVTSGKDSKFRKRLKELGYLVG